LEAEDVEDEIEHEKDPTRKAALRKKRREQRDWARDQLTDGETDLFASYRDFGRWRG
jgi:hypothetical protein